MVGGLVLATQLFGLDKECIMRLNVGWSVELGLNLGLVTLPVRRHSWEWKPKEKAAWQIKLLCLRQIIGFCFLVPYIYCNGSNRNRSMFLSTWKLC